MLAGRPAGRAALCGALLRNAARLRRALPGVLLPGNSDPRASCAGWRGGAQDSTTRAPTRRVLAGRPSGSSAIYVRPSDAARTGPHSSERPGRQDHRIGPLLAGSGRPSGTARDYTRTGGREDAIERRQGPRTNREEQPLFNLFCGEPVRPTDDSTDSQTREDDYLPYTRSLH